MTRKNEKFPPPAHLSPRSQGLWRELVPSRAKSAGRVALVQTALEALDRADAARAVLEVEGMVTTTKRSGVAHLHPLLKVERESRQLFARIWHGQLYFHFDSQLDGRSQ